MLCRCACLLTLFVVLAPANSVLLAQSNPFDSKQPDYPNWSAFTRLSWTDDKPFVQLSGEDVWYELVSFHGIPVADILEHCEAQGWDAESRFTGDLVQIVRLMGYPVDQTTDLVLRDEAGNEINKTKFEMKQAWREQALLAEYARNNPFYSGVPGYPKWSAFVDMQWQAGKPRVQVAGDPVWYELVAFHGIPLQDILDHCAKHNWDVQRRMSEDLVQIVRLMGHGIDKQTRLQLRDEAGNLVDLDNVVMTGDNLELLENAASIRANPFSSRAPGYPNWSAFTAVRWHDDQPHVQLAGDDRWYELVEFHGIPVSEIAQHCISSGWPVRHRMTEDLVQIVRLMGHEIEQSTDLVLRDEAGQQVNISGVAMTAANHRLVQASGSRAMLTADDVMTDLQSFQESLEEQFAYLNTNDVDYRSAIEAISRRAADGSDSVQLANELQLLMARFIDGHAGVSSAMADFEPGYLPLLIETSGDRFVAVLPDRSGFLDDAFPYIRAIDGIELERWLAATEPWIAAGSPQMKRDRGLRLLRHIQQFRKVLVLDSTSELEVELVNRDGSDTQTQTLTLADDIQRYGTWPPVREPELLDGNIGYLRLRSMNRRAVELLQEWMPRFRETDGLIVDVRGNGGGSRTAILELAGYLLSKDDEPRIGNVAKYRLAPQFSDDHLSAARYIYRESSDRFDQRERAAIAKFRESFRPRWEPPEDEFSEWHYLVLSKRADDPRFHYDRPVTILLDEECFSATDIFLSAFQGWPNVTLVGQPSGGGSARTQAFALPISEINIRCASMASFQPDGRLYDTNGIQPDQTVVRPPEYYLSDGPDVILDRAIELLQEMRE